MKHSETSSARVAKMLVGSASCFVNKLSFKQLTVFSFQWHKQVRGALCAHKHNGHCESSEHISPWSLLLHVGKLASISTNT